MKWSNSHVFTIRETPADAEIISHQLLVRGGFLKKLAPGIFTLSPFLLRAVRKFECIVREELNKVGALELLMPMVQPKELWDETGRWQQMGDGLLKFKNRNQHDFCLGATHEEVITDYVRRDVKSYRDLPVTLYQIQTKFRDEVRPRFGLMRCREFIMKDAYSFDRDQKSAQISYEKMHRAYTRIFTRLGLKFRVVQADAGNIGGSQSQEFQILAESGEDRLLVASQGDFAANIEICPAPLGPTSAPKAEVPFEPLERFPTPNARTINDLVKLTGIDSSQLVKTLFFEIGPAKHGGASAIAATGSQYSGPICLLVRGCDEANPIKLKNILGLNEAPVMLTESQVFNLTGAHPGSCGPVGLQIPVYADHSLQNYVNFIVGANCDDIHLRNVNFHRDFTVTGFGDFRMAFSGLPSPDGKGVLEEFRGIEVGHIFYLGTKYSEAMDATYLSEQATKQSIEMGCYGIGITRTVQAAVEQSHDQEGIIWPAAIAPFHVHICLLDPDLPEVSQVALSTYTELWSRGIEAFLDDRAERPGVKFKDADLLGFPLRINIGGRSLKSGVVELIDRKTKEIQKIAVADLIPKVVEFIAALV